MLPGYAARTAAETVQWSSHHAKKSSDPGPLQSAFLVDLGRSETPLRGFDLAPPKTSEDDGTDRPSKAELAKAKTAAEALVAPADGVTASVFRLDTQTLVPATGDPLTTTLVNHAAKRAERKKKLVGHKLDSSDIEKKINDARNQMLGGDGWPKRWMLRLERSLATLRQELDRYEKNVHDPELLASARAEVAWPDLNDKLPRSCAAGGI